MTLTYNTYPDLELLQADPDLGWSRALQAVANEPDICVFWMDDDKPIGPDFLYQMTQPEWPRPPGVVFDGEACSSVYGPGRISVLMLDKQQLRCVECYGPLNSELVCSQC